MKKSVIKSIILLVLCVFANSCSRGPNDKEVLTLTKNKGYFLKSEVLSKEKTQKVGNKKIFSFTVHLRYINGGLLFGYVCDCPEAHCFNDIEYDEIDQYLISKNEWGEWEIVESRTIEKNEIRRYWRPESKTQEEFYRDLNVELALNGGSSLIVEIGSKKESDIQKSISILRTRINRLGVSQSTIKLINGTNRFLVEVPGIKEPERIRKLITSSGNLELWKTYELKEIYQSLIAANILLRNRPDLTKQSENEEHYKKEYPLFAVLQINQTKEGFISGPIIGYARGQDTVFVNRCFNDDKIRSVFPADLKLIWSANPIDSKSSLYKLIALKKSDNEQGGAVLKGNIVKNTAIKISKKNESSKILLTMSKQASTTWTFLTKENAGKYIAFVLDGYVYSYQKIQSEITSGKVEIDCDLTDSEAKDLADLLESGVMEKNAYIIQENDINTRSINSNYRGH